jgi:outer membrane protein TolC
VALGLQISTAPVEESGESAASASTEQVGLQRVLALGPLGITLQEAVRIALENNPTLKIEKIRVEQARSRIGQEKGEFDPLLNSGSALSSRDNIVASRFYPTGLYTEKQSSQSLGVESKNRAGGRINVGMNYAELHSNSNIQTLSPQYSANLSVSLAQPFLRDFGSGVAHSRLRIAEKGASMAENNLYSRISQLIQRVEETYWNLSFLQQDLEEKRRSLENARQFLAQNENLLRAGRIAPVAVLQARAAVAERQRDAITSQTAVDDYKDRLENLLWLDLDATDLTPTDPPEVPPFNVDVNASIQSGLAHRPELKALQQEEEQRDLEVKFAANQTKPRLDLTAQFNTSGLSGRPNPTCLDPTAAECIPVGNSVIGSVLQGQTGARDAFSPLLSANPYESWSVELKFQLPIGNKTAKARYTEAALRRLETRTSTAAMRDQVTIEIRNAIREVQASQERIDASREAVRYLETQLGGMRQQLEAGLVSSYDVLQAFQEVDRARTTELQALMDFNIALSKFRLAEGSGLPRYQVEIVTPPHYSFDQTAVSMQ